MSSPVHAEAPPVEQVAITLAPMRRRHLRTVLATERTVYPKPWTMALFLGELARPESRSYVIARSGAVVVGHAGVLYIAGEGHVTTIAVDPDWQRRQVATRLMLFQLRHAAARGAHALTLEVRVSNMAAQELYRRFGFAPAGVRKAYYPDNDEDALIMWAHDIDSPAMAERLAAIEGEILGSTALDGLGEQR
jgi:ribosomal-protein-alanine N-acetyltransferase